MKTTLKYLAALVFLGTSFQVYALSSMCPPANYNPSCEQTSPVCGQLPMPDCPYQGDECPVIMPDPVTYRNYCEMEDAGAELLFNGSCNNPNTDDLQLTKGYRFLTQSDVDKIVANINEDALSPTVVNHGPRDFYDRYSEYWTEVLDELTSLVYDLYGEGILSRSEYVYLTQFTPDADEKLQKWKQACGSCRNNTCSSDLNCGQFEELPCCPSYCPNFCNGTSNCLSTRCPFGAFCDNPENFCGAQFDKLQGFFSSEVSSEVPRQRRTEYVRFLRDTIVDMIQVREPAATGEMCTQITCRNGLSCAPDPRYAGEVRACSQHSDCQSNVCERNVSSDGRRYCRPVLTCYQPITTPGASCVENPVCAQGLTCTDINTGVPMCSQGGSECASNDQCCSGSCKNNRCEEIRQCLSCAVHGEEAGPGRPCCPGVIQDPSEVSNLCIQIIPEDLEYEHAVGKETHFKDQEDPFDLKKCEFDWYQSYLAQLKEDTRNFEREMSLLSFEFVAGGDDFVDDYWDINSRLKSVVDRRRALRHHLIKILRADISEHETVLQGIEEKMRSDNNLNSQTRIEMMDQYRSIAALKEEYDARCEEINRTIASGGDLEIDGADADGQRANEIAKIATSIEQALIAVHDTTNTSPSFAEIDDVRLEVAAMAAGGWKRIDGPDDGYKYFETKWTKRGFGGLLGLAIGLAIAAMIPGGFTVMAGIMGAIGGAVLGNMFLNSSPGSGGRAMEIDGVYEAMWGMTPPRADVINYKTKSKWYGKKYYFRLEVRWPKSYCPFPDSRQTHVMGVSGSCLKRFAYTMFDDEPTSLVDPFVPIGMDQRDLFRCRNQDQRDFVPLVNAAANESIRYLLRRKKNGLNSKAIQLAFPDISRGNKHILDAREDIIGQKAVAYLEQEFPDLQVTEEFITKWARHTYLTHYIFPKLSHHGADIGYPKRGLDPYLAMIQNLLRNNVNHNAGLYDYYGHRMQIHGRLLSYMTEVGYRAQGDINTQIFDIGSVEHVEGSDRVDVTALSANLQGNQYSGAGTGSRGPGSLLGDKGLSSGQGDFSGASGLNAIREQFERNRQRNNEINERMAERSRALREQMKKQGIDSDFYDNYYANLYATGASQNRKLSSRGLTSRGAHSTMSTAAPQRPDSDRDSGSSASDSSDAYNSDEMYGSGNGHSLQYGSGQVGSTRFQYTGAGGAHRDGYGATGDAHQSEEMRRAQSEIARSVSSLSANPDRYNSDADRDTLFEMITKSYFRNYDRLLNRRTRDRSISSGPSSSSSSEEEDIEFMSP